MNKLSNIDWDSVKVFIRTNTLLCVLAILDIVLLFAALQQGSTNASLQERISTSQIKEKAIRANLGKLSGLEKDFEALKGIKNDILKKCINLGKKVTIYNFLKQIDSFLPGSRLNISNTSFYDINKKQNINFNQDLTEFDGDNIIAYYNISFLGKVEELTIFLKKLDSLPLFINLQKLELHSNSDGNNVTLNVNLSFSILGKIQLKES